MSGSVGDLPSCEARERAAAGAVLAIPFGATEQHGPHLPLSTDSDIAVALARALARARPDVLVAPTVAYGASGEHADFAGTLSIGQRALELLTLELCRSACATFARVVLVNAHGGNAGPLARAVHRLRAEGRDVRAWAPRFDGDAHAGRTETSLMLALAGTRVRRGRAVAGNVAPLAELLPGLRARGVRAVSASGVLGDPAGACASEGEQLLQLAAEQLAAFVERWQEQAA
jgi:creatinine amidohydrolase